MSFLFIIKRKCKIFLHKTECKFLQTTYAKTMSLHKTVDKAHGDAVSFSYIKMVLES